MFLAIIVFIVIRRRHLSRSADVTSKATGSTHTYEQMSGQNNPTFDSMQAETTFDDETKQSPLVFTNQAYDASDEKPTA